MSEAKNEIRLNALVMRSLVSMLPDHDDLFWIETPDDLKCDIAFAKESLQPYVAEFDRLQEIDKTTNVVTAEWSKRCQELEDENERMKAALTIIAEDETDYPRYVAALFVQPDGCYAGWPWIDYWDEARDARKYSGPLPVVAHPPCQLWGALAAVNYKRWGGDHNKPGNDGGCFAAALEAVNTFGGVLEHPAKTRAFAAHGLPKPEGIGWQATIEGGWVCEVWQSAYGHRANKATWLYYNGSKPPLPLRWERPVGTHQVGRQDSRGKARNKPTLSKREANATPLEFRDELLKLALHAAT